MRAKLKELLYALRLEYRYPKSKILEFYANQFYVSGNGRGLGVAAHYYFDKPVEDLDVLECAFIAGSVKSPNTYNPFVKRDDLAAARARMLAKRRTGYVLEQMYKLGMIDPALYQTSIRREIPFRQGKMSYSLNTVMDLVKDALDSPQVQNALAEHGIANVATSGVRIYTTVEHELQEQGCATCARNSPGSMCGCAAMTAKPCRRNTRHLTWTGRTGTWSLTDFSLVVLPRWTMPPRP